MAALTLDKIPLPMIEAMASYLDRRCPIPKIEDPMDLANENKRLAFAHENGRRSVAEEFIAELNRRKGSIHVLQPPVGAGTSAASA